MIPAVRKVCRQFKVRLIDTKSRNVYAATEEVIPKTKGKWLCFPNDDCYLVPFYSRLMMREARKNKWDIVYCDCIYDPRMDGRYYQVYDVKPLACRIDKICIMIKRKRFNGFPHVTHPQYWVMCDGLLMQKLADENVPNGKCPGPMAVHN